ncbi:glycosyltransferase family 4 protein [Vibrio fluvialis]|uniref:glycosyltransferase family 4 protein n=1 Tax=Vibrio fluvialis TaxID=676 RepID=UPI0014047EB1|nr:glycosyltransferase family 4 protein [Vibrio fluvialis]NHN72896.1 glycosyltransferase family 4 protein [Vibrio fluvialis]
MNILVINTAKKGGRAKCAYHISKNLSSIRNCSFTIVYPSKSDNLEQWEKVRCNELMSIDFHSKNLKVVLESIFEIIKLSRRKFDRIIFTATHPLTPLYISFFESEKTDIIIHDPIVKLDDKFFDKKILYSFYFYLANTYVERYSKRLTLLSKTFCNYYENKYPKKKINYMPHGVFDYFVRYEKVKKYDICFAGRITKYKGLSLLIDAVSILENKYSVVIAGSGNDPRLHEIKQMDNYCVMNEWISDELMSDIISHSRIVVLPYLSASQSGVITLAHAAAVPVITTDVGGLSEQVAHMDTGLVIKSGDVRELVSSIDMLLKNESLLESMVRACLLHRESLAWPAITKEYIDNLMVE